MPLSFFEVTSNTCFLCVFLKSSSGPTLINVVGSHNSQEPSNLLKSTDGGSIIGVTQTLGTVPHLEALARNMQYDHGTAKLENNAVNVADGDVQYGTGAECGRIPNHELHETPGSAMTSSSESSPLPKIDHVFSLAQHTDLNTFSPCHTPDVMHSIKGYEENATTNVYEREDECTMCTNYGTSSYFQDCHAGKDGKDERANGKGYRNTESRVSPNLNLCRGGPEVDNINHAEIGALGQQYAAPLTKYANFNHAKDTTDVVSENDILDRTSQEIISPSNATRYVPDKSSINENYNSDVVKALHNNLECKSLERPLPAPEFIGYINDTSTFRVSSTHDVTTIHGNFSDNGRDLEMSNKGTSFNKTSNEWDASSRMPSVTNGDVFEEQSPILKQEPTFPQLEPLVQEPEIPIIQEPVFIVKQPPAISVQEHGLPAEEPIVTKTHNPEQPTEEQTRPVHGAPLKEESDNVSRNGNGRIKIKLRWNKRWEIEKTCCVLKQSSSSDVNAKQLKIEMTLNESTSNDRDNAILEYTHGDIVNSVHLSRMTSDDLAMFTPKSMIFGSRCIVTMKRKIPRIVISKLKGDYLRNIKCKQ